ncbi:MAG TPA: serine/threonine-protein kinase [Acidimicrobiales bacterium]
MTSVNDVLGGRYRLVRLLGRGGMSDVYLAIDEHDGSNVALKIVRSGDPEFARRLEHEARALESFMHPGLIRLLDTGFAGDQAFLVMEFVDGPTLATLLRDGPLSSRMTADLGARLAEALSYVHARGIVHRDVKPSNVLMSDDGEAWIGDFGIARLHDASTFTATGTTMGTVSYMAPEQLENHGVGPAADIWSLGIVLLECLTGQRVYQGTPSEVMARRVAGPVPLPDDLPTAWRLALSGMLDRRPEQRLSGTQVAALLSTSAFDAPWVPLDSDLTTNLAAMDQGDRTAMLPGAVVAAALVGDETGVTQAPRPPGQASPVVFKRGRVAVGAVALVVLGVGLFFAFDSGGVVKHPGTTTTQHATTTSPPTTTTTVALGTRALSILVNDVTNGESSGGVDTSTGQTIIQQATMAVSDYSTRNTVQAASDLQQAALAIANGIQSSAVAPDQGAVLQSDLNTLANTLNLSAASTPPATTSTSTTTTVFPGNGNGNGQGNGNGP